MKNQAADGGPLLSAVMETFNKAAEVKAVLKKGKKTGFAKV